MAWMECHCDEAIYTPDQLQVENVSRPRPFNLYRLFQHLCDLQWGGRCWFFLSVDKAWTDQRRRQRPENSVSRWLNIVALQLQLQH